MDNQTLEHQVAGGGSGFYGGNGGFASVMDAVPGAGGSGYIGNPLLKEKYMVGYNVETSDDIQTKTMTTTNSSETPTSDYAKQGNGHARITNMNEGVRRYIIKDGKRVVNFWVSNAEAVPGHSNSGSPTITENDGYITFSATGGGTNVLSTNVIFDFSNYSKLCIDSKSYSNGTTTLDKSSKTHLSENYISLSCPNEQLYTTDISTIVGEGVFSIDLWYYGSISLKNVWLE